MIPAYPLEGVVSWNMNTTCNYRCSYCTQRFVDDRKQWAKDVPRFVEAFLALPGDWEIKLSGGEPFLHPEFLPLVRALAEGGRRVSVVTNFSASKAVLEAYAEATRARPGVFSASLHVEYAEPLQFLEKLAWFQGIHAGFVVATCVATREVLPKLPMWVESFRERGVTLRVQPEKQDREVIAYSAAERDQVLELGGHNGTGQVEPNFQGRLCWAGARYWIVDHRGEVYRCYPARRYRQERLGNLLDGSLRIPREASPCLYAYCNCTVPQQRGMVEC